MALSSAGKSKGIDDPNAKLLFQRLGHFIMTLGLWFSAAFKHYYTQDSYRLAHMRSCRGICFAVSARLFVPLNKLCPTMQKTTGTQR